MVGGGRRGRLASVHGAERAVGPEPTVSGGLAGGVGRGRRSVGLSELVRVRTPACGSADRVGHRRVALSRRAARRHDGRMDPDAARPPRCARRSCATSCSRPTDRCAGSRGRALGLDEHRAGRRGARRPGGLARGPALLVAEHQDAGRGVPAGAGRPRRAAALTALAPRAARRCPPDALRLAAAAGGPRRPSPRSARPRGAGRREVAERRARPSPTSAELDGWGDRAQGRRDPHRVVATPPGRRS